MNSISANKVKELRDISGAGMMDCKKALLESGGDIQKAMDFLRKSGIAKAQKKSGREVKDGGGILPDIEIDPGKYGNIIASLFKERLFFDFATDFRFSNDSISDKFICSDLVYNEFVTFLSGKEYSYKTETEKTLEKLKKKLVNYQ